MKIAIIGAGMAGLSCADALTVAGHDVALFDKGRGPGGRMSTRRVETSAGHASFDHGAQYFTVRDPNFAGLVADWSTRGLAARWPDAGSDTWVGVPSMNAVIKHMAQHHHVEFGFLVKGLTRKNEKWQVVSETAMRGDFDAVVLALPAEQAASILALYDFSMARSALLARSQPCWTAMFAFASAVLCRDNIIKDAGPIAWAARNNAKPGRGALECWVVQANATWSSEHLEESADFVAEALKQILAESIGAPIPEAIFVTAHRWRYALSSGTALGSLWNDDIHLGVCGDWLLGPRVECAWLSGQALALQMLDVTAPSQLIAQPTLMQLEADAAS